MQQRALIIGWMATIMAVGSASADEDLILEAACGWWGCRSALACLLHDQFSHYNGFREGDLNEESSAQARVLPWCDLTVTHDTSVLSKTQPLRFSLGLQCGGVNGNNASLGAQLKWCFVQQWHGVGLLARQDPVCCSAAFSPTSFSERKKELFAFPFGDEVLRESFFNDGVHTCKSGAKWSQSRRVQRE